MSKYIFLFIIVIGLVHFSTALAAPSCGTGGAECVQLVNPIKNASTVPQLLGLIIRGALGIIGALTLLMFVWGGFQWLTSAGNTERIEKGTGTMLWAAIGVIVVFSSYLLVDQLTTLLKK